MRASSAILLAAAASSWSPSLRKRLASLANLRSVVSSAKLKYLRSLAGLLAVGRSRSLWSSGLTG
jgi:hypothetical protein